MKVEQFVMAYGVEQDRRSVLCKDGEIFWPLMIFPEARYYHFADVEKDILQLATLMRKAIDKMSGMRSGVHLHRKYLQGRRLVRKRNLSFV